MKCRPVRSLTVDWKARNYVDSLRKQNQKYSLCYCCFVVVFLSLVKSLRLLLKVLLIVFIFWAACGRFNFPSQWCKDSSSKPCTWNDSRHKEWSVENCWTLLQFHTSCHWWTGMVHCNFPYMLINITVEKVFQSNNNDDFPTVIVPCFGDLDIHVKHTDNVTVPWVGQS